VTDRQAAKALHMHMRYEGLNSGPAKSRMRGSTRSLSKRAVCAGPADGDRNAEERARRERGESEERARRERGVRAPDRQAVAVKALHPHMLYEGLDSGPAEPLQEGCVRRTGRRWR
jgi:hypothetical protein